MVSITPIIGFLGAITAASLFFPQVFASFKSRRTSDIAWSAIFLGMLNGVFWTTYGFLIKDPFILVTNTIMFLGAGILLILKRRYG